MSNLVIPKQFFGFGGLNTFITELAVGFTRERSVKCHINPYPTKVENRVSS